MADPSGQPAGEWYAGDFHAHSSFSADGTLTPAEVLDVARAGGLAFMSATDHNTVDGHEAYGSPDDVLVIPGIEVTLGGGHFNAFGAIDRGAPWLGELDPDRLGLTVRSDGDREPSGFVERLRSGGLATSINHPLTRLWAWWDGSTRWSDVDLLEVWNDPTWPDNRFANRAALELWTDLLNAGHRIPAVGGSDFHNPDPKPYLGQGELGGDRLHMPTTYVRAASLTVAGVLDAARQGRAYVSLGPELSFTAEGEGGGAGIGDTLAAGGPHGLAWNVRGPGPMEVRIVHNGRPVDVRHGAEVAAGEYEHRPEAPWGWYRLDVCDDAGTVLAFTNPIYHGVAPARRGSTFGEFVDHEALAARDPFPPLAG